MTQMQFCIYSLNKCSMIQRKLRYAFCIIKAVHKGCFVMRMTFYMAAKQMANNDCYL